MHWADLADRIEDHAASILLAIPSAWCFTCTVSLPDVNPKLLADLIKSEAEARFPMGIESLLFWVNRHDDHAFVIAADRERVGVLLHALEESGHHVAGAVPAACLLAAHAVSTDTVQSVLIRDRKGIDALIIQRGRTAQWTHRKLHDAATLDGRDIDSLCVQTLFDIGITRTTHRNETSAISSSCLDIDQLLIEASGTAIDCMWSAHEIKTEGNRRPSFLWFHQITVPIALILILLVVGVGRRSAQLRHSIALHQAAQREVYQSVRPNTPIPVGIADRMQSLLQSAEAQSSNDHSPARSILEDLRDLLIALPTPDHHDIDTLQLDPDSVQLSGIAARHEDASRLASIIRSIPSGHFAGTGSPRIDLLADGTVGFGISGTLADQNTEGSQP
ncbi:MAG: hypothetical protein KC996_05460 [Phycisphaerales bacterium]|nr:hypothetical protein [Phycisphaerales bacterium]